MKRFGLAIVAGAMLVALALPAQAQEKKPLAVQGLDEQQNQRLDTLLTPPAFTMRFSGELRTNGIYWNNLNDFQDSKSGLFRDSDSEYLSRFRLVTIIESADKTARVTWALEIGEMDWGRGGGSSGGEFGCAAQNQGVPTGNQPVRDSTGAPVLGANGLPIVAVLPTLGGATRVGRSSGGCLGNDGVNVETKWLNLWFQVPGAEGLSATLGAQSISFLDTGFGTFFGDDGWAIKLNWKIAPVDIEAYTVKVAEFNASDADDVNMFALRAGFNATPDIRITGEFMVIDTQNVPGQSIGDNFFGGLTVAAKIADISLDGTFVYGQRLLLCRALAPCTTATESGWGIFVSARIPVGPVNITPIAWYTTGDSTQGPAGFTGNKSAAAQEPGTSNGRLTKDSDKLPMIADEDSYVGQDYVASWLFGDGNTLGGPSGHNTSYSGSVADMTGTYGIGAQAEYALTPNFSIGGGAAFVLATDAAGPYGDNVIELDAGAKYRVNANLSFQGLVGYLFPDKGDAAWGLGWRARFVF